MRRVAGTATLALALLGAPAYAGTGEAGAPVVPPELQQIFDDYQTELAKIQPRSLFSDPDALKNFIAKNEELLHLKEDEKFNSLLAALSGARRVRGEDGDASSDRAGQAPARRQRSPEERHRRRRQYEEEYYRRLDLDGQPWLDARRGRYAFERGDYETALRDYERAIAADPERADAWLGYGHAANKLGDYELARKAAERLLEREPKNADALGLYHFAKGRAPTVSVPSAIFHADAAAMPSGGGAFGGVAAPGYSGVAADSAAPPPAAPNPGGAAAEQAQRSAAVAKEASVALRLKNYPTAHQLASQAITLYPENVQALYYRAVASSRMGRYADAVTDASAALKLAPNNPTSLQARSWAFAKQGRYKEALADADASLAQTPAAAAFYQSKAFALAGLKDRAGALDALKRSAQLDPRFAAVYERAVLLPDDQDLTLLFSDDAASAAAAAAPAALPPPTGKRFARLALLSATGGILVALAILNVVSASWRDKVRATIRRALAPAEDAVVAAATESRPAPTPLPGGGGSFWTQYELVKEIGIGGMGVVYEALDRSLERRVAVKKMRDEIRVDPRERSRFVTEARTVAQLRHPNIVDIYGIVEDGAEVFLVFEFVEGRTLHDRIRAEGPLAPDAACKVLRACAEAVEHAHSRQIVHRDLKPSNIMLLPDGRVKVMDFGVARQAKDALTKMSMTNTVVGTPPYMAPEQEQGTVRRESDVFALGVCLYEMLTGHLPFAGSGAAMLLNKINGKHLAPSKLLPTLPPALDPVLAKALEPDPDKRYRTPSELVAALEAALGAQA